MPQPRGKGKISLIQAANPDPTDFLASLLASKSSSRTKTEYCKALKYFFHWLGWGEANAATAQQFLSLPKSEALSLVLQWKDWMLREQGLAEATVNLRLAAIKGLANHAQKLGLIEWNLAAIPKERHQSYRDTTGIEVEDFRKMMAIPDRNTLEGKRNFAILMLLWNNALRREEVTSPNIGDFKPNERTLWILAKGRGNERQKISLNRKTIEAIADYLDLRQEKNSREPLFISHSPVKSKAGGRLTGNALWHAIARIGRQAGIAKQLSPHKFRHSSITNALDAGFDIRDVQKLSRHKNPQIVMIYDDNRQDRQLAISDRLGELL